MPASVATRLIWVPVVLLALAGGFIAALPWIASTQIVRDRIALEVSVWSGYRVTFGSTPRIEIWPVLRATMDDVRMWQWDESQTPVVEAERIVAELSPWRALRGNIVFNSMRLLRPSARISRDGFKFSMPPSYGRFSQAIDVTRRLVRANPASPDLSSLPDNSFGTLEIVDGRLSIGEPGAETEVLTGFAGRLVWPALNGPAALSMNGIWRGEAVSVEASSPQPLLLLAGGDTQMKLRMQSSPLNIDYEGHTNLEDTAFVDGKLKLSAPSLRRALEWSRSDIAGRTSIGTLSIDASLSGEIDRLKLADAVLSIDSNTGRGTLELALDGLQPAIGGTLAFDALDLTSLLAAFSSITPERMITRGIVASPLTEPLGVDLRLSAQRATAGSLNFTDVAATAQVRNGLAAFDISDAEAFGGNIQAGIRLDGDLAGTRVEMRFKSEAIDMGAFAKAVQATHLIPIARGDISAMVKGQGLTWYDILHSSEGSFTASFGPGALAGIDLARFLERSEKGEFFPLREAEGGTLAFKAIDVKARIQNGIARLERFDVQSGDNIIALSGLVPLPGRALALQGHITPKQENPDGGAHASFFVGGSWESPFVSPVLQLEMDP